MAQPSESPSRPLSPARLAANRANAQKSRGPKTPEGKARSRANALQHGLTGAGVVRPPEFAAELEAKARAYEAALRPRDQAQRDLVAAAALGAWRFDQARRREMAELRRGAARAGFEAAAARAAAIVRLAEEPAGAVRELCGSVAGLDWLIAAWAELRAAAAAGRAWSPAQQRRALNLLGLPHGAAAAAALGIAPAEAPAADAGDGPDAPAPAPRAFGAPPTPEELERARAAERFLRLAVHGPASPDSEQAAQEIRSAHEAMGRAFGPALPDPEQDRRAGARRLGLAEEQLAELAALRAALAELESEGGPPEPPPEEPGALRWSRYETAARRVWHSSLLRLRALQAQADRDDPPPAGAPQEPRPGAPAPGGQNEPNAGPAPEERPSARPAAMGPAPGRRGLAASADDGKSTETSRGGASSRGRGPRGCVAGAEPRRRQAPDAATGEAKGASGLSLRTGRPGRCRPGRGR
jgi:hypothetical protein